MKSQSSLSPNHKALPLNNHIVAIRIKYTVTTYYRNLFNIK